MASNSFLKIRQSVVWKTELPAFTDRPPRVSPHFTAMGYTWFFQMQCETYTNNDTMICIHLVKSDKETENTSFLVQTGVSDGRDEEKVPVLYKSKLVQSAREEIWWDCVQNVKNHIVDLGKYGDVTLHCTFHESAGPVLSTDDKSVQVTLDASGSLTERSSAVFSNSPLNFQSLSDDFRNMLENNLLPDVQLRTGEYTVAAHKNVLAARSKVFSAMFQHEMVENKSGVVDIKDMDPPVLDAFLKYVYSGKVADDLEEDMVPKLYAAGDKYAVDVLKNMCSDFLAGNISEENFLRVLVLADVHEDKELEETVVDFLMKNDELLEGEMWDAFSEEYPKLAFRIYRSCVAKFRKKTNVSL